MSTTSTLTLLHKIVRRLPWRRPRLLLIACSLFLVALVLVPVGVTFSSFAHPDAALLSHLLHFVMPELLVNTFWLVLGVGVGVVALGVSLAWMVALYQFPGRKFFYWALQLPLALPAYVMAFVLVGLLDFTGPLQSTLRQWGIHMTFPNVRGRGGVILVMTLALYPYVFIIARNAFDGQGARALEVAQSLGLSRMQGFFRVALPMARPWIATGLMLALMETLSDFGTMTIFNYDTFTTAIYKAWYSFFSLPTAAQLSSVLITLMLLAVLLENLSRRKMRFSMRYDSAPRLIRLPLTRAWVCALFAATVFGLAFAIPLMQLVLWASKALAHNLDAHYFSVVWHSLLLSALGAGLVVFCALILAYAGRHHRKLANIQRIATLGYAFPGAVLAVGFFIPIAWLDNVLIDGLKNLMADAPTSIFKGTLFIMLLAYLVRFLAVGFAPVESGLHRIPRSLDEAAWNLGVQHILPRVHLPLLKSSLWVAFSLVFVEIIKEMPITLMTRPFGWDTLAVRVFEMTAEGQWEQAALPALTIVLVAIPPVVLLARGKIS